MTPRFDYTSMGFITFDALCRPVTQIPPGGGTYFVEELTLAVSGAAGSAVIVAAKHGLRCRAVGGVGFEGGLDGVVNFGVGVDGAFALDETGRKLIFRDTLQIDSLNLAEFDACVNSLGLLLSEFAEELIQFSKPSHT